MAETDIASLKNDIKSHFKIFAVLSILAVINVFLSYFLHHLGMPTVFVVLIIAAIQGTLIAGFFMHLRCEKKIIYFFLALTLTFVMGLLFLTLFGFHNIITGSSYVS